MNVKHIIAIATLTITSSAVFADAQYPIEKPFVSTKTRAEVIAELQQARAQGLIANRNNYPIIQSAPSQQTRAQVATAALQENNTVGSLYRGR